VRVSVGVGSSGADVDALLLALEDVLTGGERWTYAIDTGRWAPAPDPRRVDVALTGLLPRRAADGDGDRDGARQGASPCRS
jgi:hypothetical protein